MATIKYRAHCAEIGWQGPVEDGSIAGTIGEHRALEAFRIEEINLPGVGVHAFAHVQDIGWSGGNIQGEDVGSTGLAKHIEAVKMGLFGENADKYDIFYRLHIQDKGFLNWSANGAINGTVGGNVQAEAIQIFVTEKGSNKYPVVDSIESFADLTPPPAPQPAAVDRRQLLLDTARSYIGYLSYSDEDSWFGQQYAGSMAGAWCAYFVRWCCDASGVGFPATGYCPTVVEWAQQNGRWTGNPEPGFLVLYDFNYNGTSDHIGIVEQVIDSGHIIAIEGNTGDPTGVYRKDRDYGILGYVNPF